MHSNAGTCVEPACSEDVEEEEEEEEGEEDEEEVVCRLCLCECVKVFVVGRGMRGILVAYTWTYTWESGYLTVEKCHASIKRGEGCVCVCVCVCL